MANQYSDGFRGAVSSARLVHCAPLPIRVFAEYGKAEIRCAMTMYSTAGAKKSNYR